MEHPTGQEIRALAEQTSFRAPQLEKTTRLIGLLQAIADDEFLGHRLALKGGTALNAFHLNHPRLSLDIDLNYIHPPHDVIVPAERPRSTPPSAASLSTRTTHSKPRSAAPPPPPGNRASGRPSATGVH